MAELYQMVQLAPVFKDYLWGGVRLREQFGKRCDYDKIAESWELSLHKDGTCTVASGPHAGTPLGDFLAAMGPGYIGGRAAAFPFFPVLIKLIDAKDPLSIQVHPSDDYALAAEGEYGKTEVWYIVDAAPDSFLYYGLTHPVSQEEFARRVADNTVTQVLNRVAVRPGEVYFIPAGTIHAIGAGILICEIQQNSNLTYRVYDYDRRDAAGNPRPLHLEKALKVAHLAPPDPRPQPPEEPLAHGASRMPIATCQYFTAYRYTARGGCPLPVNRESFLHLLFLEGDGVLCQGDVALPVAKGDSFLLPAGDTPARFEGDGAFVATWV